MKKQQPFEKQVDLEIRRCADEIADRLRHQPPDKIADCKITNPFVSKPMPLYDDIMNSRKENQKPLNFKSPPEDGFVKKMVKKISDADQNDFSSAMPSFKLDNHILADQRRLASSARKAPGKPKKATLPIASKPKPITPPLSQNFPAPPPSPQQRIITEIVAREIALLTA